MKPHALFFVFPAVVFSEPEAKPEPVAEPQLQGLIPLAIGGLTLGAIGLGASAALGVAARDCECARSFQSPPCYGSFCECKNQAAIACWASRNQQCKINLTVCAANGGQSGSPTGLNSEYPPCGQGLPNCNNGKTCRKLDNTCKFGQSCIGLCVPLLGGLAAQGQQQQPPWWQGGQGKKPDYTGVQGLPGSKPSSGPARCPSNFSCPQNTACVQDPQNTGAQGPAFKCVDSTQQCGGFQNLQCQNGLFCVPDPRVQCTGQGCLGLCA
ncbi:Superoxide-generating NADPH oxidase heavy chain subunit A [Venturia inaequalis]|nr:Superoxide-generating NADPH oxidase heavy chain subunit A [Venturia inaequalis]